MQYRTFGTRQAPSPVSALGFGCMRLPTIGGKNNQVDEETATAMLDLALDGGVNYVDTAYGYHGGNSERWLGRALAAGRRERFRLATKLPTWEVKSPDDFERLLNEQLARLQTQHIDCYLLHNLHDLSWPKMAELGVTDWLPRIVADGRAGAIGFSYHGSAELFPTIVDAYDWDFCQIQYNYLNEDVQAGTAGLGYAASKGLGVVIMEPLLGGCLATPPPTVAEIWQRSPAIDPVDAAFQWLWDNAEVSVVLSGMSRPEQMAANIASAGRSGVGTLPARVRERLEEARDRYATMPTIACTRCGYCMPCPQGVDIPWNFQLYNDAEVHGGSQRGLNRNLYRLRPANNQASACIECGACEEKCPQAIAIPEELKRVTAAFEPPEG